MKKKIMSIVLASTLVLGLASISVGAEESEFEPMNLVYTTIHNQGAASVMDDYFMNYITEATDGAVTWTVYYGGTFAAANEELDLLSSGAVDVCSLNVLPYASVLTMLQFPRYTCNGYAGTVAYANEMLFDNEETSAIINAQLENNNIHCVGVAMMTNDGYISKPEITCVEDLENKIFGTGTSGVLEQSYGLNVVDTPGADAYDSLSRGVVDCVGLSMSNACDYSLYEVSSTWVFYNRIGMNGFYSINNDTWNSFSEELQDIFTEAGKEIINYSAEYYEDYEAELQATAEENGVTVLYVDDDNYAYNDFSINANNALATANAAGQIDDMKTLITAGADFLGFDVTDILDQY